MADTSERFPEVSLKLTGIVPLNNAFLVVALFDVFLSCSNYADHHRGNHGATAEILYPHDGNRGGWWSLLPYPQWAFFPG